MLKLIFLISVIFSLLFQPFSVVGAAVALTEAEVAWLATHPTVKFLAADVPPLVFSDERGLFHGLMIDYLERFTAEYGVVFEPVRMGWPEALQAMAENRGLDAMPLMRSSPEREEAFSLSRPYLNLPWVIFARDTTTDIGDVVDLAGRKVAFPQEHLIGNVLKQNYPTIELQEVADVAEAIAALAGGKVDAYIGNLLIASYLANELGYDNLKIVAPFPLQQPEHVFAARKDWPELAQLFNRMLGGMNPQDHADIRKRWLAVSYEPGVANAYLWRWSVYAFSIFLLLSGVFFLWNRSLKKQIRQRKSSEEALVNSVVQYQNLLQTIPHGVIELNSKLQISYCNTPFTNLLGYQSRQLLGLSLEKLIPAAEMRQEFLALATAGQQSDQQQSLRLQLLDKQLQLHDVQFDCDCSREFVSGGKIIVVTDLTRQQRIEKTLLETETIYSKTFESIQAGVAHLTSAGKFSRVNKFLCQMLGYDEQELLGKTFLQITHPDDRKFSGELLKNLLAQKENSYSVSKRYLKKDGRDLWVLVSVAFLEDAASADHFVVVVQDIHNLKQQQEMVANQARNLESIIDERTAELQKRVDEVERLNDAILRMTADLQTSYRDLEKQRNQLDDANKELESFAYSVSHDLRAPLRHVQGFADILLENSENELSKTNRRHLATIMDSAARMGHLIDDLLAFSRAGRSELNFQPVSTALIVKEAVAGFSDETVGRDIEWQIDALPFVTGDLATLRQVFANLLDNAVKYSAPRQKAMIRITCEEIGDELIFWIRDNGVGFDSEYAHKLFGVFSRLHRADEFEGTGIGLANVKRIVTRHGGRVWAESILGEGADFYFSLPARKDL